jgi:flavin reductase (DIM6/NTAB) family NADH-FMN oxidoreductase RutF
MVEMMNLKLSKGNKMEILDYQKLSKEERVQNLYSTIIPRPIAWIVTENGGVINIAPFSFYTGVSTTPPVVMVAIGNRKDGTPKDTLKNILETQKAVICTVSETQMEKMKLSGESLDFGVSEAEKFDIPTKRVLENFPPLIENSSSALFCKLHSKIEFEGNTTPIFLEVEYQIRDEKIDVIGRVGKTFATLKEI